MRGGIFRQRWPSFQEFMVDTAFKPLSTFKESFATLAYNSNDSEELTRRKKYARKYLFWGLALGSAAFFPMLVLTALVVFGWVKP